MKDYPVFSANGHLAENTVWNIPAESEVRGNLKSVGPWQIARSYRALAVDSHGRVFGLRTMSDPHESGYVLEGKVSIEGKKYRAFTSSRLFTRANGSLCDVAVLYVCGTPDLKYRDPVTIPESEYRAYLADITSRYHYARNGTYADLCRYATCLERIADGWAAQYPHCETEKEANELRASLAPVMDWKVTQ